MTSRDVARREQGVLHMDSMRGEEDQERTEERPTIVCLCGSTRFTQAFQHANFEETLAGRIVLTIGCDCKSDEGLGLTAADKERLDRLHLRKIDFADEILVLNVDGYVGASTRREIAYAAQHNKRIRWLEREKRSLESS